MNTHTGPDYEPVPHSPEDHQWVRLGNLEVCKGPFCSAHRAITPEADAVLAELGDDKREPLVGGGT